MLKIKHFTLLIFLLFSKITFAQQWGDYTLVAVQNQASAKLVTNTGTTYKTWALTGSTGYSSYLLPNQILLRTVKATGASFSGGGICGRVQKANWSGAAIWDYTISDANKISHHDVEPLPNGNVLVIVYERKTAAQGTAVGYTSNKELWSEGIYEVQPNGTTGGTIVWEWHLWDHLVQNVNTGLSNYGVINQHPELLNINYNSSGGKDWMHMNGIDYNPALDQIVFSSHFLNEVYIIDHSTSTAQAASHAGGNGGKGGDFLYRWGNPAAYGMSGTANFNVLHDAHWIPAGSPNAGDLVAFSNNGGGGNSSIDRFTPPLSGLNYTLNSGQPYGPSALASKLICNGSSSNMSNSQQLPNGNQLYCIATAGSIVEVNSAGTTLWTYNAGGTTPQATKYDACYVNGNPSGTVTPTVATVCSGQSSTLNLMPTVAGNYTYSWSSSNGGFSSSAQNPVVNPTQTTTYTVQITSGTCSGTASATVNVGTAPTASAGNNVSINAGQSTTLTASGGSTYSWSNGQNTVSINVTPSITTTYMVTVTNSSGCSATSQVIVTVNSVPVSATANTSNATICQGLSTSLSGSGTGGTGTYIYAWSSPNGFTSSLQNPSVSPSQTTTYTLTVTSGTSTGTASVTINVNPSPTANAGLDVSINQGQSTTLTATGGNSYSWSNGQNTASINVTPSQTTTYNVVVTDGNACTAADAVLVTVIPTLVVSANTQQTSICLGNSTTLTSSATGGIGNYTYSWTSVPSGFSSSFQNPSVSPNQTTTYTVVATSGNNTSTASVTVNVNNLPTASAGSNVTITNGQSTTLAATGGTSYNWSNGQNTPLINVSPSQTTTYNVVVTNASGCTASSSVMVTVQLAPVTASASATNTTICQGFSTTLNANATGGTGIFSYAWSSPNGFSSTVQNPSISPTQTTTYTVTATSGNISGTASVIVNVNPLPTVSAGNNVTITEGQSTTLTATGGTSYVWNSGQNTASISVTPSQTTTYIVTATNANGCKASNTVIVNVNLIPTIIASITPNPSSICLGTSTQLNTTVSGGTGTFTYLWTSTPSGFSSTLQNPVISPTQNTTYAVTVTSGIKTTTANTSVTVNSLPLANAGADATIVIGNNATLTATGGTSYLWSNNANTASINVSPQNTTIYIVTVTGQNGCTKTDSVQVSVTGIPLSATVSATPNSICKGKSTQLNTLLSGANGNSTFVWSASTSNFTSTLQNPSVTPDATTTYNVTVTNAGNTTIASVTVTVNSLPIPNAGNDVSILLGETTTLTASGGTSYLWSNAATTQSISVSPQTTTSYIVTVTNASACSAFDQVFVNVILPISATITPSNSTVCAGFTSTLSAAATGGAGTYTYNWSSNPSGFSSTVQNIAVSPLQTTTYTCTVSDGKNTGVSSSIITVNPTPKTPTITKKNDTLFCSSAATYQWFLDGKIIPNATNASYFPIKDGKYEVQITDKNACISPLSEIYNFIKVNSVDVENNANFAVFPNPTHDIIFLKGNILQRNNFEIKITNVQGKVFLQEKNKSEINLSNLPAGTYFIILTSEGNNFVRKIVLI